MNGVERVSRAFTAALADGRAALITFLVAGDPDPDGSVALAAAAAAGGADIIEVGFPFNDPLADGPVIQDAYGRALAGGLDTTAMLQCVRAIGCRTDVPIVVMAALNLLLARGVDRFCQELAAAGAAGLLVPDLPVESAGRLRACCSDYGLATVFMVAPDSHATRVELASTAATGFLYVVRRRGVTGRDGVDEAADVRAHLRRGTTVPVAAGFGITTAEDAARAALEVDGVIVGSALVEGVERALREKGLAEATRWLTERTRALREAVRRPNRAMAASPYPTGQPPEAQPPVL